MKGISFALEIPIWMMVLIIAATVIISFVYFNYTNITHKLQTFFGNEEQPGMQIIELSSPSASGIAKLADVCWSRHQDTIPEEKETTCYVLKGGFSSINCQDIANALQESKDNFGPCSITGNTNALFVVYNFGDNMVYVME